MPATAYALKPAEPQAGSSAPAGAAAAASELNPTNRVLRFIVPLNDGPVYLGDVELIITPTDEMSITAPRLLQILEPLVTAEVFARLQTAAAGKAALEARELEQENIKLHYDTEKLALSMSLPAAVRRPRTLSLDSGGGRHAIDPEDPAGITAYVNLRSAVDYVHAGARKGFDAPISSLDGAMRVLGLVAEGEGFISLRKQDPTFRRIGSRVVYDDLGRDVRFTAGDLLHVGRSFQGTLPMAGVSAVRLYNLLSPQREIRSTGAQSFTIMTPSMVETIVNGRSIERRRFEPGTYTLQDFPLAEGTNEVSLLIEDETGGRRTVEFNLFSNRSLLATGLSEFAFFAGVPSRPTRRGIRYGDDWQASGFWRRGLSPQLTAGLNAQLDARVQQVGTELLVGTPIGLIGVDLAGSRSDARGAGYAAALTYQQIIQSESGFSSHAIRASVEYRSPNFTAPGLALFSRPQKLQASFTYSRTFGPESFATLDLRYLKSRDAFAADDLGARVLLGFRLARDLSFVGEAEYRKFGGNSDPVVRVGIVHRFGPRGSIRSEIDSRGRLRGTFQNSGGRGIGAWNFSSDLDRTTAGTTFNNNGTYTANRGEFGISHFGTYDSAAKRIADQRTSLRAAGSLVFADGLFAVARPILDSFLIAEPHRSLRESDVRLDPMEQGEMARSSWLGPAVMTDLTSYSTRTVVYDVPEAPTGYDLGSGNVQLVPPYRGGYRLLIGSDYNLTVFGRLLDKEGEPISLLAGSATEVARPKRPAVTMFTSRDGRFAASGLRAGRWRIEMPTKPATVFEIIIPDNADGLARLGDLRPAEGKGGQ